jgi:hypothetical protein
MNKVTIGKLLQSEKGMPMLEVCLSDDKWTGIAYLSPFRGYRFQISETFDGQGDLASTPVLGLANIILATENYVRLDSNSSIYAFNSSYQEGSAAKDIFTAMAIQCIADLASRHDAVANLDYSSMKIIDEFIGKCYDYLKNLMERLNKSA